MSSTLTDEEYKRAIELCFSVCEAAHCPEGGPTVVGSFLSQLHRLLSRPGLPQSSDMPTRAQVERAMTHDDYCVRYGGMHGAVISSRFDCSCEVSQVLNDLEVNGWIRFD